jgi:hypothetical protein
MAYIDCFLFLPSGEIGVPGELLHKHWDQIYPARRRANQKTYNNPFSLSHFSFLIIRSLRAFRWFVLCGIP